MLLFTRRLFNVITCVHHWICSSSDSRSLVATNRHDKSPFPLTAWEREWKWVSGRGGWWWRDGGVGVVLLLVDKPACDLHDHGKPCGGRMPEMTSCPHHLLIMRMDERKVTAGDILLSPSFSFSFFCTLACLCYRCCCCMPMQLSQALSLWVYVCVGGCVCAAAEGVVLRPWCAALSFRERSHRQPPQEALAPPPWNDPLPPPPLTHPPPSPPDPPPFLFSDLTQQANTELSER